MRKLVNIIALVGLVTFTFAQTEKETVNWLDNHVSKIDHINCPTIQLFGDHFELNNNSVKLYNDSQSCKIDWNNVKNIKSDDQYFYVVSNDKVGDKNVELKFFIKDTNMKKRFIKAMNHMVSLKNKGLVKNDLFK